MTQTATERESEGRREGGGSSVHSRGYEHCTPIILPTYSRWRLHDISYNYYKTHCSLEEDLGQPVEETFNKDPPFISKSLLRLRVLKSYSRVTVVTIC